MPHRPVTGAAAVLLAALALAQTTTNAPRLLRPLDKATLPPGPLVVVARGSGALHLDGKPIAASQAGPGAFTALVTPAPGPHTLTLAGQTIRFHVGANPPADFLPYRVHPPAAAPCDTCHGVRDGVWEFKGAASACFHCHDPKKFPEPHAHNPEVLAECGLCHNPHGSTTKFHLKLDRDTACKQCHG